MYTRHACAYLIGLLPIFNASAQHPWPTAPDEIARHLTSADQSTSFLGLEGYIRLPEDQRTSDVKAALIECSSGKRKRTGPAAAPGRGPVCLSNSRERRVCIAYGPTGTAIE